MSVTTVAHTILGVCVERDALYEDSKVRVCEHPGTKDKFCPKCGKPMWENDEKPIKGYDECEKLGSLDVVTRGTDSEDYFIGKLLGSSGLYHDENEDVTLPTEANLKKVRKEIEKYFPIKVCEVRLWTVLYQSY